MFRKSTALTLISLLVALGCGESGSGSDQGAGGAPIATGGAAPGSGGTVQGAGGASGGAVSPSGGAAAGGGAAGGAGGGPTTGGSASGGNSAGGSGGTGGDPSNTGGADGSGGSGVDVDKYFGDWPNGADPLAVGKKAAEVFRDQNLATGSGNDPNDSYKHYKDACAWYGALWIAGLAGDTALTDVLVAKYTPYKGTWSYFDPPTAQNPNRGHVDDNVFGIVPLEIAKYRDDAFYVEEGDLAADHQVTFIEDQIRFAIDDMFMITSLQVQAYRVLTDEAHRKRHLDTAAATMVRYLETMQEPDGLFPHHRDNAAFRISWGRGNGWYAAGMAEMIRELPDAHENATKIRDGYLKMMNGLLEYQIAEGQPGAGLWKQVVDSNDNRNWAESSGSAMFAYALITGVRRGWLDVEKFGPAARRAWIGLVAKVNGSGQVQDISDWAYLPSSHQGGPTYAGDEENYYFQRPKLTGDNHGQAPLMWAAAALVRPLD